MIFIWTYSIGVHRIFLQ